MKQGSHKPGGTVTEGKRRAGEAGGAMVVRENGVSTRRQAGRYQKRVIAEQRGGTILYPHRWPSLGTRRCSFGILLQVAHRGDESEGNNSPGVSRSCPAGHYRAPDFPYRPTILPANADPVSDHG